jgi:response regulator RpfG family c-di-GMP phosphodiesterase
MSDGMALEKLRDVATTEEHLLNTDLVLIVDDDEDILELAAEILQTLGYDVLTARNGVGRRSGIAEELPYFDSVHRYPNA